jgi:hypothetical protein
MAGYAEILNVGEIWPPEQLLKHFQGTPFMGYHLGIFEMGLD